MTVVAKYGTFATKIQNRVTNRMPDRCSLQVNALTDDNAGGWGESLTTPVTGIPCRFNASAGMEQLIAGTAQGILTGVIYLPAKWNNIDLALTVGNRIPVDARGVEPARTFEVTGLNPGEGVLISAEVRLITTSTNQ
jgi:hypothetical protein